MAKSFKYIITLINIFIKFPTLNEYKTNSSTAQNKNKPNKYLLKIDLSGNNGYYAVTALIAA